MEEKTWFCLDLLSSTLRRIQKTQQAAHRKKLIHPRYMAQPELTTRPASATAGMACSTLDTSAFRNNMSVTVNSVYRPVIKWSVIEL